MRVLFTLEYYVPHIGGAEVLFKNLCEGLTRKGHDITVVTLRLPGTQAFELINGVKVHRVKVPQKGARYWFTFLSIPKVFQLARQADLIHTTTYNGAFPAWLASRLRGKKCLITVHELFGSRWKNLTGMTWLIAKLHQLLERVIIALPFDMYISVSEYTSNCVKNFGVALKKAATIYNSIDYDLFNPEKADSSGVKQKLNLGNEFIYIYYGRPGISKGVEYLVRAVPLITQKIPNSKLVLILADDPKDRYENIKRMITNLNIEDNVVLLAPVPRDELPNYIAASDCVAVPSLSEGFGFSAAEACAMGKPVVASNVASLPEVVSGRFVLVKPGNSEAIAKGIEDVYNNRGNNSEKRVFSWDVCINKYLEVYKDVMHAKHK
jgi:glycosyltransferase involved in cell wall biosynthesis